MNSELAPSNIEELEERLSRPTQRVIATMANTHGDIVILGAGGKMGPTLARMARRALDTADVGTGPQRRVFAVSRFSSAQVRERLEDWEIETIACDLLDPHAWADLPDAPLVVSMTGFKFGTSQSPDMTWAMNCYLPALACQRYSGSRMVAFSSGNVYGLVPVAQGGARETDELHPVGEYSMAAVGRERILQYFSRTSGMPLSLLRLNYATELRYGVLVDIARRVAERQPIDLRMGYVNVIWLADANAIALSALDHATSPATIINVTGLDVLSVRDVAQQFAQHFNTEPHFINEPLERALLNDGTRGAELLGQPLVSIESMIAWTADWIARGGEDLGKPTHYEQVDGRF